VPHRNQRQDPKSKRPEIGGVHCSNPLLQNNPLLSRSDMRLAPVDMNQT